MGDPKGWIDVGISVIFFIFALISLGIIGYVARILCDENEEEREEWAEVAFFGLAFVILLVGVGIGFLRYGLRLAL